MKQTFSATPIKKKIDKAQKGDNEFRTFWITKVYVVSSDMIPSIRRRISVVQEKKVQFTPLQTAVNNLNEKNKSLDKTIETCEQDPTHDIKDLSMQLNGILDAAVMGGVAKYREAFFDGTYMTQYPAEVSLESPFKDALRQQLNAATVGLACYEKYAPENLMAHVEHLQNCLVKMNKDLKEFLN